MKRIKLFAIAAALSQVPLVSIAGSWDCDPDIEVRCSATACAVSEDQGTIPIGVTFDSEGNFSLCAYSGCWEAKGKVVSTSPFLVITAVKASWSNPDKNPSDRRDILIAFSPSDRIALIKVEDFAMPMRCKKPA